MNEGGGTAALDAPHACVVLVRRRLRRGGYQLLFLADASQGRPWTLPRVWRRHGESVYGCALRAVREGAGVTSADVWAVDLSGDTATFACDVGDAGLEAHRTAFGYTTSRWMDSEDPDASGWVREQMGRLERLPEVTVGFRPMTRADFPDVVRWVRAPHVARWWDDEATDVARAERHYGPALDGRDPTRMWVVELNGRSVGFVQDYRIGDHPEYALLTARPEAIGVDYAIGEARWVGQGIGTRVLWTFLRDVVRPDYAAATTYFAAPDHRNAVSLRVLDKLGFQRGLWFDEPQRDGRVDTLVGCTLDVRRVLGDPRR